MLGQHVYIERDMGQENQKDGLWLSDYFIVDTDTNEPYVWAMDEKKKLEKRYVTLGQHDDELGEYEIVDGLDKKDCIAFPTDSLEEGESAIVGDLTQTLNSGMDGLEDYSEDAFPDYTDDYTEDYNYTEDYTDGESDGVDADIVESSADTGESVDSSDDGTLDMNEELIPMDEAPGVSASEDTEGISE